MAPNVVTETNALDGEIMPKSGRQFTLKEVALHNKVNDRYIIVKDKVLDVTEFAKEHPGGEAIIMTYAGEDATDVFGAFHSSQAYTLLGKYTVGELVTEDRNKHTEFVGEIRRLRQTFKELGYFKSSKLYYAFKVASNIAILSLSIFVASYNTLPTAILGGFLLALFWQQCGWLAHDFLHHQVFENRKYNNWAGLLIGNIFQGFSVDWWKKKHNQHHAVPNVHGQDPDIDTMPFLAWSEHALEGFTDPAARKGMPKFVIDHQQFFFTPLLSLARLSWALQSIYWVRDHQKFNMRTQEAVTLFLHWFSLFVIMFSTQSIVNGLVYFTAAQTFCGILLASVFALNHNGMVILDDEEAKKMDFYTLQIVTGRDVDPTPFNSWFTGGLCFQIHHHLFPLLPRHNFHKVQPLVESLCKKYNVPCHKVSFIQGTIEVFQRLAVVGDACKKMQ